MALGIFAGTGMDVRAEGNWEFVSVSPIPDTLEAFITENDFVDYYDGAFTDSDREEYMALITSSDSVYIIGKDNDSKLFYVCLGSGEKFGFMNETKYGELKSRSWYILKKNTNSSGGSTTPIDVSGSGTNSSTYSHTHSYSWVTVQEANAGQDGIEEYRCSCGNVQGRSVIPASAAIVDEFCNAVKNAPVDGIAEYDSGWWHTMSDYLIRELAKRPDVTTVITFEYERQMYKMTIPAGVDYTALLADEDYFYGYFYFANAVGATIETIKTTQ